MEILKDLTILGLTASRAVSTDADKKLVSSAVTATELGHLSGVTSGIQTQFTGKANTIHNLIDTTNHPVSGLTPGHFLKALTATTYGFEAHGLTASSVGAEPTITGGTSAQYWTGSKSWVTLNQAAVAGLTTSDTPTFAGITISNAANGISLLDTGTAFYLKLISDSTTAFTATRTLTFDLDNANRTLKLTGNVTGNQDVSSTASPTFVNLTITSFAANWTNASRTVADLGSITTCDINGGSIDGVTLGANSAGAGTFSSITISTAANGINLLDTGTAFYLKIISDSTTAFTASRTLTIDLDNVDRTLKITGNVTANQDVTTTGTPQHARLGLGVAADSSAVMKASGQYYSAKYTQTFGATMTINWDNGNVQYVALTNNVTSLTLSNPKDGGRYALILLQDSTGSRTVAWPVSVKWPISTAPTLSGANKLDVIAFIYDGTNSYYYGTSSLNYL